MKVLKFGGTSVGTTDSIKLVGNILQEYHRSGTPVMVVVSAMRGITNLLLNIGDWAVSGDLDQVNQGILELQNRHFHIIKQLLPVRDQSQVLSHTKRLLN
jgi:aspartokinase/homoserine dehydrogenase 1